MGKTVHFLGLDVHKDSIAVSLAPANSTEGRRARPLSAWDRRLSEIRGGGHELGQLIPESFAVGGEGTDGFGAVRANRKGNCRPGCRGRVVLSAKTMSSLLVLALRPTPKTSPPQNPQ